jgi:hypothetical protein
MVHAFATSELGPSTSTSSQTAPVMKVRLSSNFLEWREAWTIRISYRCLDSRPPIRECLRRCPCWFVDGLDLVVNFSTDWKEIKQMDLSLPGSL